MKNFLRALRLGLEHRMTVVGCVVSALVVALLWLVSLTGVYPVIDVIMTDRAVPEWVDDELAKYQSLAAENEQRLAELRERREGIADGSAEARQLEQQIEENRFQLDTHSRLAYRFRWAQPYAHRYLPTTPFDTLMVVIGLVAVGTLVKCAFRVWNAILVARLGYLVGFDLRKEFYRQTLRLDMKHFSEQGRGDLMNRCTTDLNWISAGVQTVAGQALLEPLKMLACFFGAAFINWRLLLLTMIIAPVAGLSIHWLAKALKRTHRRAMQELSAIFETLSETLAGIKLIKAFTMESAERSRFHNSSKLYYQRQMKIASYNSLVSPLTEFLGVCMVLVAAMIGGYLVLNRQTHILGLKISDVPLTHGWMGLFFAMMAGMSAPARRLSTYISWIQQALAASDRVYEILDQEPGITDPLDPLPLPQLKKAIRFDNLSFHYSPDKPVLEQINLDVRAGETIAIVGPNGCGKSTLLNLMLRFYDPVQGTITIDGVDISQVRIRDLRSKIGLVNQETLFFNDTVAANIRYGNPDADQAMIEAAARKAHAHSFITEKLSEGYETLVGPGGNRLSGGQRQRLALARAILRDPEILILDEATSQIDLESEQLIHQVLEEFLRTRTALVVTHRMSTISLADRVVVMEAGRLLDVGTHQELLGRCDLYRRLANLGYRESA
jgi:ATP-binding cassette subfamily B protein/subfamily B ATP-binding cassette protein MsbA